MRGADRISGLPGSVVEQILMFLPLREAARTSVLSREWRNKWVQMPNLVLDENFGKVVKPGAGGAPPELAAAANCKFMLDVFEVLSRHCGRLKEFSLTIPELRSSFPDHRIDTIMGFLDNQHIESLAIEINDYVLPRGIYSFTRLRKLKLCGCQLTSSNVAFDSAAFAKLDVLELRDLKVPQVGEACFGFNCPLLSALTMEGCSHHAIKTSILIEAPKLEYFRLAGSFSWLEFKHTPQLKTVDVHQDFSVAEDKGGSNIAKFTASLPAVEQLSISGYFYDYLSIGAKYAVEPARLRATLNNLKHLRLNELCIGSTPSAFVLSALYLMNISNGLAEVIINIGKPQKFFGKVEQTSKLVNKYVKRKAKLKRVKVNEFDGASLEMAFVRSLLAASPALDKMDIEFSADRRVEDQWSICKALLEFARASPTAQIAIK